MISHKHKCIFIHIPKTAGTSINSFFHPDIEFHYAKPDYERLFGWCPKRKLHMQHATPQQLIETELVTEEQWDAYFKFAFVRNPWDRAYSDYKWIQDFSNIKGSFKHYISGSHEFESILTDNSNNKYLGDHLLSQTDFFELEGKYKLNFIGRFENFMDDINSVLKELSVKEKFNFHENKSNRKEDYSKFYTSSMKKLVDIYYKTDIEMLNYRFEDNRYGFHYYKRFI